MLWYNTFYLKTLLMGKLTREECVSNPIQQMIYKSRHFITCIQTSFFFLKSIAINQFISLIYTTAHNGLIHQETLKG